MTGGDRVGTPLLGRMMARPLLLSAIVDHMGEVQGEHGLIADGGRHSYTETASRIRQLARALRRLGIRPGDRVATLAWNDHRHVELLYAIAGIGAVCHTLNPRMAPDTLRAIATHAGDSAIFFDPQFRELADSFGIAGVALDDAEYEPLLAAEPASFDWPEFDENTACGLCYTSGTTGAPKGVLYSHRSTLLAALSCAVSFNRLLPEGGTVLAAVPLFHANAWGLAFMLPLVGGSLALPGPRLDGASLFDAIERCGAHGAWGAPAVWTGLLEAMRARRRGPEGLAYVVMGGAPAPAPLIEAFEAEFGIEVVHGWGMTEMSPIGAMNLPSPSARALPDGPRRALQRSQGRRPFGVEMRVVDTEGATLPRDGVQRGDLMVRGPSVAAGYFREPAGGECADGWFATGDVATLGPTGLLTVLDRHADMIKSGGEWISPGDIEVAALMLPEIRFCAVIGRPHPRWGERPVLVAVGDGDAARVLAHLRARLPKWQVPDAVVFVDAMPLTATGKISRVTLRERFGVAEDPKERAGPCGPAP